LVAGCAVLARVVRPRIRDASEATTVPGIDDGAHLMQLGAGNRLSDDAVLRT